MKININIEDHNTGFTFTDNEGNILDYNTMSRADQLVVLRVLSDAWVLFSEHLNRGVAMPRYESCKGCIWSRYQKGGRDVDPWRMGFHYCDHPNHITDWDVAERIGYKRCEKYEDKTI